MFQKGVRLGLNNPTIVKNTHMVTRILSGLEAFLVNLFSSVNERCKIGIKFKNISLKHFFFEKT